MSTHPEPHLRNLLIGGVVLCKSVHRMADVNYAHASDNHLRSWPLDFILERFYCYLFHLGYAQKMMSIHGRNARHPGNDVDANSFKISICSLLRFVWMWLGSRSCVTDGVEAEEGFGMLLFDSWSIPCSKFLTNHVCICFMEILKGLLTPSEALLRSCVSMVGGMGSLAFPCFFFWGGAGSKNEHHEPAEPSCIVTFTLFLAWFLANIVPFFRAAVDLLGASVTPLGNPEEGHVVRIQHRYVVWKGLGGQLRGLPMFS